MPLPDPSRQALVVNLNPGCGRGFCSTAGSADAAISVSDNIRSQPARSNFVTVTESGIRPNLYLLVPLARTGSGAHHCAIYSAAGTTRATSTYGGSASGSATSTYGDSANSAASDDCTATSVVGASTARLIVRVTIAATVIRAADN